MVYIALGCLGFIVINAFDIVCLKKIPVLKIFTWISGSGLLVYAIIMASLSPDKLPLPIWATWTGWILLLVSFFLLTHSLFINLPFRKTYVNTGVGDKLIKTGLYALVRHPWIHCFIILMLSLFLVSGSKLLLTASPIWILLDILLIYIQDRFVFGRMFAGYSKYRQETPMLIPNKESITACIKTINQSKPRIGSSFS